MAADVFVCAAAIAKLSGSHPNRLNWLPFKSALTLIARRKAASRVLTGDGATLSRRECVSLLKIPTKAF